MAIKACNDCRWFVPMAWACVSMGCHRPELRADHPIYGEVDTDPVWNRSDEARCGKEAKLFEGQRTVISRLKALIP